MRQFLPLIIVYFLGCYHGINPGMGWLFAVALGFQEKNKSAVFGALPPVALGHTISVGAFVAVAVLLHGAIPTSVFHFGAAALLCAVGLYRLIRARHLRWVGMRVGFRDLTLWAFLMATAHGAGLMLVPVLFGARSAPSMSSMAGMSTNGHAAAFSPWYLAVAIHTVGYLLTMTAVAYVVYAKFGVALLRTSWINLDLIWSAALIVGGLLLLFL
ncbi:MAG: hypothetical protein GIW98_05465 [Candidatus Eremiobacteraeota bacterium]|nr:hypothetical protein [Candidatus Eremiobacteraeota bacterium]